MFDSDIEGSTVQGEEDKNQEAKDGMIDIISKRKSVSEEEPKSQMQLKEMREIENALKFRRFNNIQQSVNKSLIAGAYLNSQPKDSRKIFLDKYNIKTLLAQKKALKKLDLADSDRKLLSNILGNKKSTK